MLTFSGMQVQLCAAEVPQFRTAELKACQERRHQETLLGRLGSIGD